MDDLKNAIQTVYSQSSISQEEKEKAFNYLNVFSNSENGWKICLHLSFSQEPIQLRYFCLHVLACKTTNLQLEDLLKVKENMINYFKSSLHDSNDDLPLIKKMAHLYVKLVIQLYPEKWPTPFQELLDMVNNFKFAPNGNSLSLVHVDMLTSVLEIINCDVIEYALNNNSPVDRNNAKNLKESMANKDITDISSCLINIIKSHNAINIQVLDRCLSSIVYILSWANWQVFSTIDFINLLIDIINMRKSASINALRIISALSERGMNPVQKVEYMFQKLNIINIMKQLFANIINDGIIVQVYSPIEIQFLTARNKALAIVIHQIFELYISFCSGNEVSLENENVSTLIKESTSILSHIQIICFKIYPLISVLPLVLSACDIISYIKHANLENDKTFTNILIDLFTCTLKHASYPNWYNNKKGLDETEFDDYRLSLISIIRNLFLLTPDTAISELSKNIGYICSFRHRVLPSQSEIIITSVLVAIEVLKVNDQIVTTILPLFQTNACTCCNQVSFILNELSQNSFVSNTIHELIAKISKAESHSLFIGPSLQYLTSNMSNNNHIQTSTLLKFVKNSMDSFNETAKCSENIIPSLIDSIKPFIGIPFVKIGFEIKDINQDILSIHYNEVYYEILSTIISSKSCVNNYFYETLDYLYNIINQITQSQEDDISLSFWLFRVLSAFSSLIKSFTFNGELADIPKSVIKFSEMAAELIDKYSSYFFIRSISLSICRKLILLSKTDYGMDAFNSIIRIIKPFYNHLNIDEDGEYCSFTVYMLKSFPSNYFSKDYLTCILVKHIKFVIPCMEIIKTNKSSDLYRRQYDGIFHFLNLIYNITNTVGLDGIFGDFNLEGFDHDPKFTSCIEDKLLQLITDDSSNIKTLFTFLLLCCNSSWEDFLSTKISFLALQIMHDFVAHSEYKVKLPNKLIFHTCSTWIIDGKKRKSPLEQKILIEACKIIYKLAPIIDTNTVDNVEFVKVLNKHSTLNINDFTRKMVNLGY